MKSRWRWRCSTDGPPPTCAYYILGADGQREPVRSLEELQAILADRSTPPSPRWSEETVARARDAFQREIAERRERQAQVVATRQEANRLELEEQGRQVLLQAALVELAMGQQSTLFEQTPLPMAFNEAAITD